MTKSIDKIAEEIGELLAVSPIDEKIKKVILENIDIMPEDLVFRLKDALENEQAEIDRVIMDIEMFMKEQDERWKKLEEEQQKAALAMADELVDKLKNQPKQ